MGKIAKPFVIAKREPMGARTTPRKCTECQEPATQWGYTLAKSGMVNHSSRTPRCGSH